MDQPSENKELMAAVLARLKSRILSIGGKIAGEDLFGDVALACVKSVDRYSWDDPRIEGRVICIALKRNARHLKRSERQRPLNVYEIEDSLSLAAHHGSRDEIDSEAIAEAARRLIEALPAVDRHILWSRFRDEESYDAIADRLKLSPVNVRTRLCRAIKTLRQILKNTSLT